MLLALLELQQSRLCTNHFVPYNVTFNLPIHLSHLIPLFFLYCCLSGVGFSRSWSGSAIVRSSHQSCSGDYCSSEGENKNETLLSQIGRGWNVRISSWVMPIFLHFICMHLHSSSVNSLRDFTAFCFHSGRSIWNYLHFNWIFLFIFIGAWRSDVIARRHGNFLGRRSSRLIVHTSTASQIWKSVTFLFSSYGCGTCSSIIIIVHRFEKVPHIY